MMEEMGRRKNMEGMIGRKEEWSQKLLEGWEGLEGREDGRSNCKGGWKELLEEKNTKFGQSYLGLFISIFKKSKCYEIL